MKTPLGKTRYVARNVLVQDKQFKQPCVMDYPSGTVELKHKWLLQSPTEKEKSIDASGDM